MNTKAEEEIIPEPEACDCNVLLILQFSRLRKKVTEIFYIVLIAKKISVEAEH